MEVWRHLDMNILIDVELLMSENEDLPPSSKLVYKVLEYEGSLTQRELAEETRLPQRTVREALNRLQEINAITESVCLHNTRRLW